MHPLPPARLNGLRASALAACLNNATHGRATTNDTCTATQTSYPNARDTLLADTGGQLTVSQSVTLNGSQWAIRAPRPFARRGPTR